MEALNKNTKVKEVAIELYEEMNEKLMSCTGEDAQDIK